MILLAALLLAVSPSASQDCDGCKRPCLDYLGTGHLSSTGRSVGGGFLETAEGDWIMTHGMQLFRFDERAPLLGAPIGAPIDLRRGAYATSRFPRTRAIVALSFGRRRERPYFAGWDPIWKDSKGRDFIPIFFWPADGATRWLDWRPENIRGFARPIDYRLPQPMQDASYQLDEDTPELVQTIDGAPRPRMGVYLSDIPRMMRSAEECKKVG